MRPYIKIIDNIFKESVEYRLNHILSFIVIALPLIIIYFLWNTIFYGKNLVGGYDKPAIVTYYILAILLQDFVYPGVNYEISRDIREGTLSNYLIKPINYMGVQFSIKTGASIPYSIVAIVITLIFVFFMRSTIVFQINIFLLLLFLLSVILAFILAFLISYSFSLLFFWLERTNSIELLLNAVLPLSMGMILPLSFFPHSLEILLDFLPFKYLLNFPIDIYLAHLKIERVIQGMGIQVIWIIIFFILSLWLWKKGTKKYQAYGG